jgi:protein SCO1
MPDLAAAAQQSETQFSELVDALAADPALHQLLADLLREDHPYYNERGAAAIARMRGWVLLALARTGVSDRELPFVLEEFDTGTDAYLVAAAARALRSYVRPSAALAPFVMRALRNIRDEPLTFETYGEYAVSSTGTSPVRELLAVLAWLGPSARATLPELASMRAQPGRLCKKLRSELDRTVAAIREGSPEDENQTHPCCALPGGLGESWWNFHEREDAQTVDSLVFEDQDGAPVRFREFFKGNPSIVVFFYTRCDNPWKCSLTVTKLARVQQRLKQLGISDQIQTVAITYDPAFDLPQRLRSYGQDRGLHFDAHHRMLRTIEGFSALRDHFHLGVNFIASLVNRHRIELYVLDAEGRVASCFERVHWDEHKVVDRAREVLREGFAAPPLAVRASVSEPGQGATTIFGTLASLAWAFFPKCPMCWAAYLSVLGMAGMQIPYPSKTHPLLVVMMLINIASIWLRSRATRRRTGFYFVCAGTLAVVLSRTAVASENLAALGAVLMFSGTLWGALRRTTPALREIPRPDEFRHHSTIQRDGFRVFKEGSAGIRDRAGRETAASGESSVEARRVEPRTVDAPPKTRAATVIGSMAAASMTITTITGTTKPSSSIRTETSTTG